MKVLAHHSRNVRKPDADVFKFDAKHGVRQSLQDRGHDLYSFYPSPYSRGGNSPLLANFGY